MASLSQLNAGVTTTIDTSQVSHTPAHSDACVAGLKESGRRAVYTYSPGVGPGVQYPKDLVRLQSQYFSSADQLLTLELNAAPNADNWALARQSGVPIICHIVGDRTGNFEAIGIRSGRIDDGRIDNRAGGHLQSPGRQMPLHLVEQPPALIMLLEQMADKGFEAIAERATNRRTFDCSARRRVRPG